LIYSLLLFSTGASGSNLVQKSKSSSGSYNPAMTGAFGGVVLDGNTYTHPSIAESWGGFANENFDIYPLTFAQGGKITFDAATANTCDVNFRFEFQPFPDVTPAYNTNAVTVSGSSSYNIDIPSQNSNTFSSFLLYLSCRDTEVTISNIVIHADLPPSPGQCLEIIHNEGNFVNEVSYMIKTLGGEVLREVTVTTFTEGLQAELCTSETELQLVMMDSFGDGWNGNEVVINGASNTLESGAEGQACIQDSGSPLNKNSRKLQELDVKSPKSHNMQVKRKLSTQSNMWINVVCTQCLEINHNEGSWASEVSYIIKTTNGEVLREVTTFTGGLQETLCTRESELKLFMMDSYGDGWNGNAVVINGASNTLGSGAEGQACIQDSGLPPPPPFELCKSSFTIQGSDPNAEACHDDGTAYYYLSWEGGCTLGQLMLSGMTDPVDASSYGFTDSLVYFGFDFAEVSTFTMINFVDPSSSTGFTENADIIPMTVTADCTGRSAVSKKSNVPSLNKNSRKLQELDVKSPKSHNMLVKRKLSTQSNMWINVDCPPCLEIIHNEGNFVNEVSYMIKTLGGEVLREVTTFTEGLQAELCTFETDLKLVMMDSYGDGWNGNAVVINGASNTLDSGAEGQACIQDSGSPLDDKNSRKLQELDVKSPKSHIMQVKRKLSTQSNLWINVVCIPCLEIIHNEGNFVGEVSYMIKTTNGEVLREVTTFTEGLQEILCTFETALELFMMDSYGDGWNGNAVVINGASNTLDSGSEGIACIQDSGSPLDDKNSRKLQELDVKSPKSHNMLVKRKLSIRGLNMWINVDCTPCLEINHNLGSSAGEVSYMIKTLGGEVLREVTTFTEGLQEDLCTYESELKVIMMDAYGDGWSGNMLIIGGVEITLESGSEGEVCIEADASDSGWSAAEFCRMLVYCSHISSAYEDNDCCDNYNNMFTEMMIPGILLTTPISCIGVMTEYQTQSCCADPDNTVFVIPESWGVPAPPSPPSPPSPPPLPPLPPPSSCLDTQFDCGDGQCIQAGYFCDGSTEFCNANWDADCANGADEGLDVCGYVDECPGSKDVKPLFTSKSKTSRKLQTKPSKKNARKLSVKQSTSTKVHRK